MSYSENDLAATAVDSIFVLGWARYEKTAYFEKVISLELRCPVVDTSAAEANKTMKR